MQHQPMSESSHRQGLPAFVDLDTLSSVAVQLRAVTETLSEVVARMCAESVADPAAAHTAARSSLFVGAVDPDVVSRLVDDFGAGGALDIVESFVGELPKRIATIRQHLRVGNDQLLERSTTTLRCGCALVGAVALGDWCATLSGPPPLEETEGALRSVVSRFSEPRNEVGGGA